MPKNPLIEHKLHAIALNSIAKFRVRVLPSIISFYEKKQCLPKGLVQSFAALLLFYRGNLKNTVFPVNDDEDIVSFFQNCWELRNRVEMLSKILGNDKLWSVNLNEIDGLLEELLAALKIYAI